MINCKIYLTATLVLLALTSCDSTDVDNSNSQLSEEVIIDSSNSEDMLPTTEHAMIIRTNFDSNQSWEQLIVSISTPDPEFGFVANFSEVNDRSFANKTEDELTQLVPKDYRNSFMFIADSKTLNNEEYPILCVDLGENKTESFRVIPNQLWGVENNLTLSNMEFESFAMNCDDDGVFRGF